MDTIPGAEPVTKTATQLRRDLSAVMDGALAGRTVQVERNGRPLCTIVPAVHVTAANEALAAAGYPATWNPATAVLMLLQEIASLRAA